MVTAFITISLSRRNSGDANLHPLDSRVHLEKLWIQKTCDDSIFHHNSGFSHVEPENPRNGRIVTRKKNSTEYEKGIDTQSLRPNMQSTVNMLEHSASMPRPPRDWSASAACGSRCRGGTSPRGGVSFQPGRSCWQEDEDFRSRLWTLVEKARKPALPR